MPPTPHYTLISTSLDGDPAIVVVNSALRMFRERQAYCWHLRIRIDCEHVRDDGLPTDEELPRLEAEEDRIMAGVVCDNAMFLARITWRGHRDLLFRVRDPGETDRMLQHLIARDTQSREWDYRMEEDPEWALARPELDLLERSAPLG